MPALKRLASTYPFLAVFLAFQLFRFCLLPFMGLMPQDAYYFFYGENLALSYFDHPGMIAYILHVFTSVFGDHVFVIKLADFCVTSLTLYVFYKLAQCFLPRGKQFTALALFGSTILISIVSIISTPDVPLLLFWSLSLLALYRAIFEGKKGWWPVAGFFMGFAFDSKYSALLLQIGLLIFLALSDTYRRLLLSRELWTALLISVLVTFPVFYWNYTHHFASFLFQSATRSESITRFAFNYKSFLGTIGHQAFILLPVLFISLLVLTFRFAKKALRNRALPDGKNLFLLCFFAPAFVGFFLISLVYWVKINWMMPAYITGSLLAAAYLSQKQIRVNLIFSGVIHVALAVEILFYPVQIKSDDTWFGWRKLATSVDAIADSYPNTFIFSDDNYKTTAELNFFLDEKVYAQNIVGKNALQYDFVGDDLNKLRGMNAVFVDSDPRFRNMNRRGTYPPELKTFFTSVKELNPIIIRNGNKAVRKFWVYYCTGYRPPLTGIAQKAQN
ncbi:MAG: glycosyltransferase family 39 protein [Mucilaginibacter polytrichastri]|nr:glycosyltransferase family 39 protein [Mucilaginibacter polytrichastri]